MLLEQQTWCLYIKHYYYLNNRTLYIKVQNTKHMKKTLLAILLAAFLIPAKLFANPYGYREYMRPYEDGIPVYQKDNLTIFMNTDIQVELYRPIGAKTTTNTNVSYNDAEIKTTVRYDLGDDQYIVGHADIDAYRGVGNASYRTEPLASGDDVWLGIGNKVALLKMGRFATPSAYFGASMAVEGPYSGLFSRGLYPILQSDQSIALYTKPAKGWMANACYIVANEFDVKKNSAVDVAVTHFSPSGLYVQAMYQHQEPFTAYGLTSVYKPNDLGLGLSWSNKTTDAQVYQVSIIKDVSIGHGDAFTWHAGYGYKNYDNQTTKDVSGWYTNAFYVLPQAKNVNVFAQIGSSNELVGAVETGVSYVMGMRITL